MRRINILAREDRGSITIELALIAPILATMLVGLVDIGTAFSNKLRLEQIANRAVERVQQAGFDEATMEVILEAEAIAAAGTGSAASLTFWRECAGAVAAAYAGNCTTGQSTARYVQMEVVKTHTPIITAKFAGASNANGTITVRGVAGLRVQ